MRINKKTIPPAVSIAVLVANLFFPAFAQAYSFSIPTLGSVNIDINEIMGEATESNNLSNLASKISTNTEQRYGLNQDLMRQAERKVSAPRAEIFFDNTNPKPGEKVTAHATPEFFKNDPQNLYYTWYLIHTENGSPQSATNSIGKGKAEASEIMARGDYDLDLDGQTYADPGKDPDNDGWPAVDSNSYDQDKTAAPMGGSDGVGGLAEETVSSLNTATEWCDSLGDHTSDKCSFNDELSSKPLDTYFTLKSSQTNHYCDLCKDYFSGDGLTAYNSAMTTRNNCCYASTPESSLQCSSTTQVTDPDTLEVTDVTSYFKCPQNSGTDYCGVTDNPLFGSCYDTFKEANKNIAGTCLGVQYGSCKTDWATTHEDFNDDGFSDYSEQATTGVSRCYKHNFGTNADASIFKENELSGSATDNPSGLDYPIACKHKWLNAPDYTSGSGKLTTGEEEYWKTDPTDPDTDGDGYPDGADTIGLGQETFTWNYQPGDRVGVVVEGTSLVPTEEKSAYYKILWGYLDICDSSKVGLMDNDQCENESDHGYGFLATRAPGEGGEEKLKVSLTYSPDKPVADPSDANQANLQTDGTISDADEISVSSSIDNTTNNPNDLYYTWQISEGSSPAADDWKEIKDIKANFNTTSASNGLGITNFNFTPKKSALDGSGDVAYFKVTLTVATAANVTKNRGRSSVIIAVNKNGIKIKLYKVDVKDGKAVIGNPVCEDGLYKTLCPAVQYQMLAAKVDSSRYKAGNSEFSWSLDGNPVSLPTDSTKLFDGWSNTAVYFPITKEEQAIQQISVTATSKDALQPVTGSRAVTVVKPALFIKSSDTSASWPATYTIEDPDKKYSFQDIESDTSYQALINKELSYYASFVPDYLIADDPLNTKVDWLVNGTSIFDVDFYENNSNLGLVTLENNDQGLKLPASINEGEIINLSAQVKKYWSDEEKNILSSTWNISPLTLDGEIAITITTTAEAPISDDGVLGAMGDSRQILAAIGTHLPHYFMYILRLALTLLVMFFLSAGFYTLSSPLRSPSAPPPPRCWPAAARCWTD